MTDAPIFGRRQHGSALEQLTNLRQMAQRGPGGGEEAAANAAADAVHAAPAEALAAATPAGAGAANVAQPGAEFVDDAAKAAGAVGDDPDALARAVQAAAAPSPAAGGAAGAAPEAAPRANFRSWGAQDIGNVFRGGGQPAAGGVPAGSPRPSLAEQLRAAAGGIVTPAAGGPAPAEANVVVEANAAARPSLRDQLRGAAAQLHAPAGDDAARGGARVVEGLREGLSGIGALRAGGQQAAAVGGAAEEAAKAVPKLGDRLLEGLRLGMKLNPRG